MKRIIIYRDELSVEAWESYCEILGETPNEVDHLILIVSSHTAIPDYVEEAEADDNG